MNNYTRQFKKEIIDNFEIDEFTEGKVFLITVIKFLADFKFVDNDCLITLNFTDDKLKEIFVKCYRKTFPNANIKEHSKNDGTYDIYIKDTGLEALSRLDILSNGQKIITGFPPEILITDKKNKIVLLKILSFLIGSLTTPKKQFPYFWTFYNIEDVMGVKNILRSFEIESGIKILENDVKKLFIKKSEFVLKFLSLLELKNVKNVWSSLLTGVQ